MSQHNSDSFSKTVYVNIEIRTYEGTWLNVFSPPVILDINKKLKIDEY